LFPLSKPTVLLLGLSLVLTLPSAAQSFTHEMSPQTDASVNQPTEVKPEAIKPNEAKAGAEFLDKMYQAADALNDYSFTYSMTVYKDKTVLEKGKVYFKKPHLLRTEILGPNRKGSVACVGPSGKIRAHLGGTLSFYVVTLQPDSSWLQCANGYPMVESDFASMALYVKNMLKQGDVCRLAGGARKDTDLGRTVYTLEVFEPQNSSGQNGPGLLLKRALVDAETYLPVKWFDYQDGKLWAVTLWQDLKTNQNFADSTFDIKAK
jgi:outer membrane lipoprotein-sorting protein